MDVSVVILAAGQGTRMRSDIPKVLHPLAGRPILEHVLDSAEALGPKRISVVFGHDGERVRDAFSKRDVSWVLQAEQLGTGHAVQQALAAIEPNQTVLILFGDVPLVRPETLKALLSAAGTDTLAVLTADLADPTGYGRIIRDESGSLVAIVEEKDATPAQKAVLEINTGLMACPGKSLSTLLERIAPGNAQGEYYLTDIVSVAVSDNIPVAAVKTDNAAETLGINDKRQLSDVETLYRERTANELMHDGVTLADPRRLDVRGKLTCGRDVYVDVNVIFEGDVELGDAVNIGPNTIIRDSKIGAGSQVKANCIVEKAMIGSNCEIGPFCRIRPGVEMSDESKLGNFVEVKESKIGRRSKVNHLTYIGDATIGENVNVGAGTITCNYDGANKHQTIIGDGAFIGSGVELVAPVEIGARATIGAGSTITKSTPPGELALERSKQVVRRGWSRPEKKPRS